MSTINYYLHNNSDYYYIFLMYSYCNQRMSQMAQFEFKRISLFKWGKTGRGIIAIVIFGIFR